MDGIVLKRKFSLVTLLSAREKCLYQFLLGISFTEPYAIIVAKNTANKI